MLESKAAREFCFLSDKYIAVDVDQICFEINKAVIINHYDLNIGPFRYDNIITTLISLKGGDALQPEQLSNIVIKSSGMLDYLVNVMEEKYASKIVRYCSMLYRQDLLRVLIEFGMKVNTSMIKDALNSGYVDTAKLLVSIGVTPPSKFTLYNITHQLAWEPDRIKFIIENNIKIVLSDKERVALNLLYPYLTEKNGSIPGNQQQNGTTFADINDFINNEKNAG